MMRKGKEASMEIKPEAPSSRQGNAGFCLEIDQDEEASLPSFPATSLYRTSKKRSRSLSDLDKPYGSTLRDPQFLDITSSSNASGNKRSVLHRLVAREPITQSQKLQNSAIDTQSDSPLDSNLGIFLSLSIRTGTTIYYNTGSKFLPVHMIGTPEEQIILLRQSRIPYGPMPDTMGFYTIFSPRYFKADTVPPPGKTSIDLKVIEHGFNVPIYFRSKRLIPNSNPQVIPYKLHGNYRQLKEFIDPMNLFKRERATYERFCAVLDKSKYMETISPGFEELAAAFFSGEEIYDMEYYESKAKSQNTLDEVTDNGVQSILSATSRDDTNYNLPDDTQGMKSNVSKSYQITDNGDWAKFLSIAEDEDLVNDTAFMMFMTDLFMNADIENAACKHSLYHGFRVFPQTGLIKAAEKQLDQIQKWENDLTCFEIVNVEDLRDLATANTSTSEEKCINPTRSLFTSEVSIPMGNDDWAEEKPVPPTPTTRKQSGKKKGKSGRKHIRKQPKVSSVLSYQETAVDFDDMAEEPVSRPINRSPEPTSAVSIKTTEDSDDGGDWNFVQPKSTRKTSGLVRRPPNFSNRNRDTIALSINIHQRQPIPTSLSNHAENKQPREIGHASHLVRQPRSSTGRSRNPTADQTRKLPHMHLPLHDGSARFERQFATEKIGPEQARIERIFDPADYPAMAIRSPVSKVTAPPTKRAAIDAVSVDLIDKDCTNTKQPDIGREEETATSYDVVGVPISEVTMDLDEETTTTSGQIGVPKPSPSFHEVPNVEGTSPHVSDSLRGGQKQADEALFDYEQSIPAAASLLSEHIPPEEFDTTVMTGLATADSEKRVIIVIDDGSDTNTGNEHNDSKITQISLARDSQQEDSSLHSEGTVQIDFEISHFIGANEDQNNLDRTSEDHCVAHHEQLDLQDIQPSESSQTIEPQQIEYTEAPPFGHEVSYKHKDESVGSDPTSALASSSSGDFDVGKAGSDGFDYQGSFDGNRNATSLLQQHEYQQTPCYGGSQQQFQYQGPGFQPFMHFSGPPLVGHANAAGNVMYSAAAHDSVDGHVSSQPVPIGGGDHISSKDHANDPYSNIPSQSQTSQSLRMLSIGSNCTYCTRALHPSIDTPAILCPGCGPMCNIRYCSTACLLVDALDHSAHCMHMPANQRLIQHNLSDDYVYERNPIAAVDGFPDPPQRMRQKVFSMYCYSGQFPKLYKTWAKKIMDLPVTPGFDENESIKKTGDYAVFRSDITGEASRNNPTADVIFTVKLDKHNPMKQALNRALNACFLLLDPRVVEFLYRLIRHLILDEENFEMLKYLEPSMVVFKEFNAQFKEEFDFDGMVDCQLQGIFDMEREWPKIGYLLYHIESSHPVLVHWLRH